MFGRSTNRITVISTGMQRSFFLGTTARGFTADGQLKVPIGYEAKRSFLDCSGSDAKAQYYCKIDNINDRPHVGACFIISNSLRSEHPKQATRLNCSRQAPT